MQVLVAVEDAGLRAALSVWVGHLQGMVLSGVARNSHELFPALRVGKADLVILDWDLLAAEAELVLAEVQRLAPSPRTIVLCRRPELADQATQLGIDAIVDIQTLPESLLKVLGEFGNATARHQGQTGSRP